jgi:5-methylthioadenosine/S-adenosylhomocysteine deaminase
MPTQVSPVSYVLNWDGFAAKNVTALHAIWVDEEDIETLKRNDVAVAILPSYSAQMGMGMAPLNDFLRAGIRCGLGSGSATMLENDDMFNEMRIELLTQRAANPTEPITAQTLLEMATIRAAEVLRLEDRIGSIEKGKRADIIAVDLSQPRVLPTSDPMTSVMSSAHARNVLFTMVDGKAIYDRKNLEYEKISEMSDRLRATRERFLKNLK